VARVWAGHGLSDRGYGAAWFRDASHEKSITPCIPPKLNRKGPVIYDKELYNQRHRIEIMFGRLKDRHRIAMRYDRCAHTSFSAIRTAAVAIFNESWAWCFSLSVSYCFDFESRKLNLKS